MEKLLSSAALTSAPRFPLLLAIRVYQKTLSPDHGPISVLFPYGYCRFHPTCSEYGYDAIHKHGALKGSILAGYRIIRCNPAHPGGEDPVPGSFKEAFSKSHNKKS